MKRSHAGFPVSSAQGMGNRETAPSPLISNDFGFPGDLPPKTPSGKPKLGTRQQGPLLVVQRQFVPNDASLDELVDALYRLLVDAPSGDPAAASDPPEQTCFHGAHE